MRYLTTSHGTMSAALLLISVIGLCLAGICQAYNEDPCKRLGGYCTKSSWCQSTPVPSQCPTQGSDILCCHGVYQEEDCDARGGTCKEKNSCSGTAVSRLCPTQGSSIKCCVSGIKKA
ncbi:PREDICTED: uncharacterized protein LOC106806043 [Priapulus caudatus]|uniref:Uncharacterized protein LOC106806043 n=1 Tax=Priapulus caudatus TaxID=37621 RepID=A0ABM1DTV1_PRICU|nr:PREDICTED: uncharacterized protein LOC106806043 [Priapulus caudatus]